MLPFTDCPVTSEKSFRAYLHHAVECDSKIPELMSAKVAEGDTAASMAMHLAPLPCCEGVFITSV